MPWTFSPHFTFSPPGFHRRSKPRRKRIWETIAEGRPPRAREFVYNVEPFRAAIARGLETHLADPDPTSVDLYNLADDPSETRQRGRVASGQGGRPWQPASRRAGP